MTVPAIELREVTAGYGPFRALFGVSLTVAPGEAVALLGANGAGKTTIARLASGLIRAEKGSVFVNGADLTGARAYRYARAGVFHAPEGRSVFATLSVEENLQLSVRAGRGHDHDPIGQAYEMFPVLGARRRQIAGTLSGGEQRMLALAGVMIGAPRLLIGDELSLGLAPLIVEEVYRVLATIREAGTVLLVVEQHVDHALKLCDRVALLEHGTIAWQGTTTEARQVVASRLFDSAAD